MEKATEETTTQPEADTDADAGKRKRGDNESEQTEYKKQAVPGVLDNAAIQAAIAKAKQAAAVISSSMMGSGTPQMSASVGASGSPAPSRAAELPPVALPPVASPATSLPASGATLAISPPGAAAATQLGTASLLGIAMQTKGHAQNAQLEEHVAQDVELKRVLATGLQQAFKQKRELELQRRDCLAKIDRLQDEQSSFKMQHSEETANSIRESSADLLREGEILLSQAAFLVVLVPSNPSNPEDAGVIDAKETARAAKMALDVVITSIPDGTENIEQVLTAACKALHRYYFGHELPGTTSATRRFFTSLTDDLLKFNDRMYMLNTAGQRDSWVGTAARLVMAKTSSGLVADVFDLSVAGHLEDSCSGGGGSGGGSSSGGGGGIGGGGGGENITT